MCLGHIMDRDVRSGAQERDERPLGRRLVKP